MGEGRLQVAGVAYAVTIAITAVTVATLAAACLNGNPLTLLPSVRLRQSMDETFYTKVTAYAASIKRT